MVNKNVTTNSEKKPIIDNDEALRLIDLIQQGDWNWAMQEAAAAVQGKKIVVGK